MQAQVFLMGDGVRGGEAAVGLSEPEKAILQPVIVRPFLYPDCGSHTSPQWGDLDSGFRLES